MYKGVSYMPLMPVGVKENSYLLFSFGAPIILKG